MQLHRPGLRRAPLARSALLRIGGLVLVLVATAVVGHTRGWFDYRYTMAQIEHLRATHGFAAFTTSFVLIFGLGSAIGMPGLPFMVTAGAMFGTIVGSLLSWLGAMLGAILGYWIARTVGHDIVAHWLSHVRLADAAVSQARNFEGMLRLRLFPVLPLGLVNFVGGLARAPFGSYLLATAIGIAPSIIIYAYFADSLLETAGYGHVNAVRSLIIASALLLLLSLVPRIVRPKS